MNKNKYWNGSGKNLSSGENDDCKGDDCNEQCPGRSGPFLQNLAAEIETPYGIGQSIKNNSFFIHKNASLENLYKFSIT